MEWVFAIEGCSYRTNVEAEGLTEAFESFADRTQLPELGKVLARNEEGESSISLVNGKAFLNGQVIAEYGAWAAPRANDIGLISILLVIAGAAIFLGCAKIGVDMLPPSYARKEGAWIMPMAVWAAGTVQALILFSISQGLTYLKRIAER